MREKIKTIEEIVGISNKLREENKIIVATCGSFDVLHAAHINLLSKARNEGDSLILLLNSDNSIKRIKGKDRPIVSEDERALMLAALGCVDYVVVFDEDNPAELLEKIKPHSFVKGGSFKKERIENETKSFSKWGGEFKNFELEEGFSTTNIIERILEKNKK